MGYYTKSHLCEGCDKAIMGRSLMCNECATRNYVEGMQNIGCPKEDKKRDEKTDYMAEDAWEMVMDLQVTVDEHAKELCALKLQVESIMKINERETHALIDDA